MKAIIVDIDGTIADLSHRLHHIKATPPDWDKFFELVHDDSPIEPIINLVNIMRENDFRIILVSGRSDMSMLKTTQWLQTHGVKMHELHMRKAGDFRADHIVKGEILDSLIARGYEIKYVFDDRDSVVKMWRERGLTCLQVREWVEDAPPTKRGHLTLMVGPSGAGKSTWLLSKTHYALAPSLQPCQIVSSDNLRQELCGDFRDQSKNDQVFAALHAIVKTRLSHGLDTIIDATNIRRKDRLACVKLASGGPVTYIVINRPMQEKIEDAGWRSKEVIERHEHTFQSQLKDIMAGDDQSNVTVEII